MSVAFTSSVAERQNSSVQFAALPWRMAKGSLEILLITTRRTHRWIVPKGWPIAGLTPSACAAFEALEEAGVSGHISKKPIGSFRYSKQRANGERIPCDVDVYALKVTQQRKSWEEKHAREFRWCSVAEALSQVSEPGLHEIISSFAAHQRLAESA